MFKYIYKIEYKDKYECLKDRLSNESYPGYYEWVAIDNITENRKVYKLTDEKYYNIYDAIQKQQYAGWLCNEIENENFIPTTTFYFAEEKGYCDFVALFEKEKSKTKFVDYYRG